MIPANWYLLARSRDLPAGQRLAVSAGEHELVLFRTRDGRPAALQAYCSHLGTHLARGRVVGEQLECPLHRWRYSVNGHCHLPDRCQRAYPVRERHGGLFVGLGNPASEMPPLPDFPTRVGRPFPLNCPWQAVAANGFDAQHLAGVHHRRVVDGPHVRIEADRLTLEYASRVMAQGPLDRLTAWLAQGPIQVRLTCYRGTWVAMESQLGRWRSFLLVSLLPLPDGSCQAWPLYGLESSWGLPLGWRLVRHFLEQDLAILQGIRWNPRLQLPEDALLGQLLGFLDRFTAGRESPAQAPESARSAPPPGAGQTAPPPR